MGNRNPFLNAVIDGCAFVHLSDGQNSSYYLGFWCFRCSWDYIFLFQTTERVIRFLVHERFGYLRASISDEDIFKSANQVLKTSNLENSDLSLLLVLRSFKVMEWDKFDKESCNLQQFDLYLICELFLG